MMKKFVAVLVSLFLAGSLSAEKPVYLDFTKSIEERVEDALSKMTLEEKVALCHAQSKFSSAGVPRLGIPEIWMSDGPHGVREEISWDTWGAAGWTNDYCTAFPALTCLAATFNPCLSHAYGVSIGEEARYREKDILLGPGVNIYRTPLNGRNFEYMGEDPFLASKMVVPYIQGVQQNGVAACVKHFALNNQEEWRGHIDVQLSDRALYEIYLPAFKAAVQEAGVWSVMGSYNQFRGQHCCHNDLLLNKILKKDWGFDGVVVSDWGGAHDVRQAALYGLDIEMGSYSNGLNSGKAFAYDDYCLADPFLEGLKKGDVPLSVVNDKARRILRLSFRTNMMPDRPFGRFVCEDHSVAARKIASEGIVLLKNAGNLLPIVPGTLKKIAVIGENATKSLTKGGGSSELKVNYEVSPLEGMQKAYGKDVISYSMGYASGPFAWGREVPSKLNADSLMRAAVETARNADLVVFVGGLNKNSFQDSEGDDRMSFELPFAQDKLIEAILAVNKKVVVVLLSGNAVALPWLEKVPALVQGWYLGSEAGNALADVLSGTVNPSGKLPFTFPKRLEDNGAHSFGTISYPGDSVKEEYLDDILVGYRWHDTKKIAPQFAFGYGLSYTTFEFGKPNTDAQAYSPDALIRVSVPLTNTGLKDGAEVVQIYATQKKPSVLRPAKELKAFRKVFLKAGESQVVELEIKAKDLAFYDETLHDWKLEAGDYVLRVGSSSATLKGPMNIRIN
jgi:beta-glucosidase